MPSGMAVEEAATLEVLAAWVAPKTVVPAVAATPGWHVIGEYYLPSSTLARLEAILSVSASGLTANVRLWDMSANAAISGAVAASTSTTTARQLSGRVNLTGNRRFQIQMECTGAIGEDKFAILEAAGITD